MMGHSQLAGVLHRVLLASVVGLWVWDCRSASAAPAEPDAAIADLLREDPSLSELVHRDPEVLDVLRGRPDLAERLAVRPSLFSRIVEAFTNPWVLFGLGAQFLFMMRFLVQWIASERKQRSHVPVIFWYFSIGGGLMLLTYAI
ncbi:MAG: lipid-A-disaccharide synthase N-terminal domain-containing protein, partial [Planctomycetota bacterium]